MLRKIKSHLAVLLMLALAFTLLIPAPVQVYYVKENQVTSCHSPDAGPGIHTSHTSTSTGGV